MKTQGGFLITRIKQVGGRVFERILSEKNIDAFNGSQGRILYILWQKDGVPISELSKETGLATTTLTSMLDRMEAANLIYRDRGDKDRRKILIFLTEEAKGLEQEYNEVTEEISNSQRERAKYNPLPMRTLLIDDCIDHGVEYNNGGARYKWSIINFAGMINVIDSMLVIRDFVFNDKLVTAEEMIQELKSCDREFLQKARNHEISFGKDNEDAN